MRLVDATVAQFGRLDIVVNNAANPLGGLLTDVTELAFEKSYAVNVRAPLLLATQGAGSSDCVGSRRRDQHDHRRCVQPWCRPWGSTARGSLRSGA